MLYGSAAFVSSCLPVRILTCAQVQYMAPSGTDGLDFVLLLPAWISIGGSPSRQQLWQPLRSAASAWKRVLWDSGKCHGLGLGFGMGMPA